MISLKERYCYKHWTKRLAAFLFDLLGGFFFIPIRYFQQPVDSARIKKILAIRLDHLGDFVMTKPALKALRERFPEASLDLLIPKDLTPLFEGDKEFRQVIGFEHNWFSRKSSLRQQLKEALPMVRCLREEKYDLGIDFRGDLRNICLMFLAGIRWRLGYGITGGGFLLSESKPCTRCDHQVKLNLRVLESLHVSPQTRLSPFTYTGDRNKDFFEHIRNENLSEIHPRIAIHAGAGYPSKRWPAERFRELIDGILDEKLGQIVLIGTADEKNILPDLETIPGRLVDLRGKTRLADLPILLDTCDLFIGNDSGPAHIAAAQGVELLVVFSGTNDSRVWHPWTEQLHLITYPVPCSPCESKECPLMHHDCMAKIKANGILSKVREILKNRFSRVRSSS